MHFYNFVNGDEKYYTIETCSKCNNCKPAGRTVSISGTTFTNAPSRVRFNSPHRYIIEDEDGTFTGNTASGCGWVVPYYVHNLVTPACEDRRWDYGGFVCDCSVKIRTITVHGMDPN